MTIRVLACGGRDYADKDAVFDALDWIHSTEGVAVLIHGAARGADMLAAIWALAREIPALPFTADWKGHGKAAGILRNAEMLERGEPDLVVAFPGGRGTADMIRRSRAAGVRVWEP